MERSAPLLLLSMLLFVLQSPAADAANKYNGAAEIATLKRVLSANGLTSALKYYNSTGTPLEYD